MSMGMKKVINVVECLGSTTEKYAADRYLERRSARNGQDSTHQWRFSLKAVTAPA